MSEGKIIELYNKGLSEIIGLIKELSNQIKEQSSKIESLSKENKKLSERVQKLESQLKKNSNNSSKPPSTDGFKKKTKSLRVKSGKKPGAQLGHEGTTLAISENPDEIIIHTINTCEVCGENLIDIEPERTIIRQVIDVPEIKAKVIEHRAEVKVCPNCRAKFTAEFPEGVINTIQYGETVKSIVVYLTQYQLIPYKRGAELIYDIFDIKISPGTMVNINQKYHEALAVIENNIKTALTNSKGAFSFDETGIAIDKKLEWLHVSSNDELTYYEIHEKRGCEAMNDIDILPNFEGTAVHDGWKSYHVYQDCDHALCNAHILRELNALIEFEKQNWPLEMKTLLLEMKKEVDLAQTTLDTNALTLDKIETFEKKYDDILVKGFKEDYAINIDFYNARKNAKKSDSLNLLNRLSAYKQEVIYFIHDFDIPFDNNLAERDIRMTKVKQKISGTFRSKDGAKAFTRIRGYVSSIRKISLNTLDCLKSVFTSNVIDPTLV